MTEQTFLNEKPSWRLRALAAGAVSAVLAIVGYQTYEDIKAENERQSLLNRIHFPDAVPEVCPSQVSSGQLTRTLAPLLDLQDAETGLRGQTLIAHALNRGVDFVVCSNLDTTTAVFEKHANGYAIRLNAKSNDLQQQAAVLQLMKEFYNTGASYAGASGQSVMADANLTRAMPGRILEEREIFDHIASKPEQVGRLVKIPMRTF